MRSRHDVCGTPIDIGDLVIDVDPREPRQAGALQICEWLWDNRFLIQNGACMAGLEVLKISPDENQFEREREKVYVK